MTDSDAAAQSAAREDSHADAAPAGWHAKLTLRFEREGLRTVLRERRHVGPLRVQKALYPEGERVCQVVVVHPPAGVVAGDSLAIDVVAQTGAQVQATTPGAAKWYKSTGRTAHSTTRVRARAGALVEWLPLETILFDGARGSIRLTVELTDDARFIGWDITCLGRTASGERWTSGRLRQALELFRDGELIWCDRIALDGGTPSLQSGAILGGAPVFGTMIATDDDANDTLLAACRAIRCESGNGALTRLPRVIVARYAGDSAMAARTYFATLWRVLRPALAAREAVEPRIWNT